MHFCVQDGTKLEAIKILCFTWQKILEEALNKSLMFLRQLIFKRSLEKLVQLTFLFIYFLLFLTKCCKYVLILSHLKTVFENMYNIAQNCAHIYNTSFYLTYKCAKIRVLYIVRLERLSRDKQSSLFGQFVSCKENEVL